MKAARIFVAASWMYFAGTLLAGSQMPAGLFVETGSLHIGSRSHSATLLHDGTVLIAGGTGPGGPLNRAEIYDPVLGTFQVTGSMMVARTHHTATLLPDGRVLIAGGISSPDQSRAADLSSAELYDPRRHAFRSTGSMAAPRARHSAVLLRNGDVLIAGGTDSRALEMTTAEIFVTAKQAFSSLAPMARARSDHAAARLPDGHVLITGGFGPSGDPVGAPDKPIDSAEEFDPVTQRFAEVAPMLSPRAMHVATDLSNGKVLITGGRATAGSSRAIRTAELFDPGSRRFTEAHEMSSAREQHTATLLADGGVLVAGGSDGIRSLKSAEVFTPGPNSFSSTGSLLNAQNEHTATRLRDGRVLLAGGTAETVSFARKDWATPFFVSVPGVRPSAAVIAPLRGTGQTDRNAYRFAEVYIPAK